MECSDFRVQSLKGCANTNHVVESVWVDVCTYPCGHSVFGWEPKAPWSMKPVQCVHAAWCRVSVGSSCHWSLLTLAGALVGQKLFSCHVCSNAFSTKGSLKVHMRLHTGAKPFKCPHCELRFRTSGRRKTHMQFHYKSDSKKARKPVAQSSSDSLQSVSLLSSSSNDPNVFIMNNSVLTGQFEQNMLQQGLVGQAILPASVSGKKPSYAPLSRSQSKTVLWAFAL